MGKYRFEVAETLCRIVEVEAEDVETAYNKVEKQYKDGEIVLTADDFVRYDIYDYDYVD